MGVSKSSSGVCEMGGAFERVKVCGFLFVLVSVFWPSLIHWGLLKRTRLACGCFG